jgi:putative tryptophan/tyrosine transport system substrate-binding protein
MRRREFIGGLSGAAIALPLAARAQRPSMPVIGFLGSASPQSYASQIAGFRQGLKEAGYTEGENVAIENRWAQNDLDRLPGLAAEFVGRQVVVIVATGTRAASAAKTATTTIPIVFQVGFDPVAVGLVTNLNRPSGNLTGVDNLSVEIAAKQLEVLRELVPQVTSMALLVNPALRALAESLTRDAQAAAAKLGLQLHILEASADLDFDAALAAYDQVHAGALLVGADTLFIGQSKELGRLTVRHAIPASFHVREFAAAGGLVSYGPSQSEAYRLTGVYTGRILSGAKPSDLPVMQATKLELVINLKTAKALGIEVPASILARADEAIE